MNTGPDYHLVKEAITTIPNIGLYDQAMMAMRRIEVYEALLEQERALLREVKDAAKEVLKDHDPYASGSVTDRLGRAVEAWARWEAIPDDLRRGEDR